MQEERFPIEKSERHQMIYKTNSVRTRPLHEMGLGDLPLNTKLDAESAGGKLAECMRKNPERNEHPNEEKGNARKGRKRQLGEVRNMLVYGDTHMIARRRPMYWLIPPATAPPLRWNRLLVKLSRKEHQGKRHTQ